MVRPDQKPLPDPIPASYYARPAAGPGDEGPPSGRWEGLRDAVADVRGWPVEKQVVVGAATLIGVFCAVQLPWRPALGLFGLLTLAATALGVDALGLRRHVPLLRSREPLHVLAGWGAIGALLMISALLALVGHGLGSPAGQLAARQSTPAPQATGPTVTPVPPGTPLPIADEPSPTPSSTPSPKPSATPRPTPTPALSPVTFRNAPLSARGGRPVTLRVHATPLTSCSIDIGYPGAPNLDAATTDASGDVNWTWRVGIQTPSGSYPVTVTCGGPSATTQIVVS
jgi:hypothetical protein